MQSLTVIGTPGEPRLVQQSTPRPSPGAGEVLIRVEAAGLIPTEIGWFSTWSQKSGEARVNAIPGHEFSGSVEALGPGVSNIQAGDEIFGMNNWFVNGAMAEYCIALANEIAPKPHTLSHIETASVPISSLTAWQALFDHGRLRPGERVLIHGAAGGVGSFAVQLAKRHGAHVLATASASNRDLLLQLGAAQVIDYRAEPFEKAATPVDLIIDTIGGDTLQRSWSVLGPGGRLVTVASTATHTSDERTKQAFFIVEPKRDQLIHIASLLDDGSLRTFVRSVVTLSQAASEYVNPAKGSGRGKTVVRI